MFPPSGKTARLKWSCALALAILCIAAVYWWWHLCPSDVGTLVELECTHEPGNATGDYSWTLKVDAKGNGTDVVDKKNPRSISAAHGIREFQKALADSRLCELPSEIGGRVVDGGWGVMRIKTTTLEKTITLGYVQPDDRWNSEVLRAEKLWQLAENLRKEPTPIPGKK
jgi:hypothetical protein